MVGSTLLYVLAFALFLSIPGSITGALFILSTIAYFVWGYFTTRPNDGGEPWTLN